MRIKGKKKYIGMYDTAKRAAEAHDAVAAKLKQAGGDGMGAMDTVVESGKNQFNYSERAAQTFNAPMRERARTIGLFPDPVQP